MGKRIHNDANKGNKTKLYLLWYNMRARCKYDCVDSAQYYKHKGISVCTEWEDYPIFKSWALANGHQENLQIDRKDSDGNYEPSNCRFVTPRDNSLNRKVPSSKQIGNYKGIRFYKRNGKWAVFLSISKGRETHLGYYNTEYTALLVRNSYILEHNLNIPIQSIKEEPSS